MAEVQSIGAADYAQYQPSQVSETEYAEYPETPEVYDEHAEQMRVASKSRAGATLFATAVIAGLALWGGHAWGAKSGKEVAQKYKNAVEELAKDADNVVDSNFGGFRFGKDLANKVKEVKEDVDKFLSNLKEAAEKAAEGAENTAK